MLGDITERFAAQIRCSSLDGRSVSNCHRTRPEPHSIVVKRQCSSRAVEGARNRWREFCLHVYTSANHKQDMSRDVNGEQAIDVRGPPKRLSQLYACERYVPLYERINDKTRQAPEVQYIVDRRGGGCISPAAPHHVYAC